MLPTDLTSIRMNTNRLRAFLLAACLTFSMVVCLPVPADAEIRKTDIIMGESMAARGIKAADCPSIDAQFAYLVDEDGNEIFERNADTPTQIASITKIMTAIIAVETASLDTEISVSTKAAQVGGSTSDLRAGDRLTLENALKGLMIPSGNDAAIAIAETLGTTILDQNDALTRPNGSTIAKGDENAAHDAFVAKMNQKASELGCVDTLFENPHGLDANEFSGNLHSTAKDVFKIARYAMDNDIIAGIVDIPRADIPVIRNDEQISVELETTDELLGAYEGACGIKTGNTDLAGPCFAGACERDGKMIFAIVLHSSSDSQRFSDTAALYTWYYNHLESYKLASSDTSVKADIKGQEREVPVVAEVVVSAWGDKRVKATFKDPDAQVEIFTPNGNVSQSFEFIPLTGSVHTGDVIGNASFYQRNELIATQEVIAAEDVPAPNFFETILKWFDTVGQVFSGTTNSLESVIINETPLVLDKT